MIDINNGIATLYRKIFYLLSKLLCITILLMLTACSLWNKTQQDEFVHLKGQHILVVIDSFSRNPDVIEDWVDYKRYTWHQCKATGRSSVEVKDNGTYYLKPGVICCDVQFETDRKNIVFGYKGLNTCPVSNSLKQQK